MITLLPTYIENTRAAILSLGNDTSAKFRQVESLLMDESESGESGSGSERKSLKQALHAAEKNILKASTELKEIVVESGNMAESLFERVDTGYKELEVRKENSFIVDVITNKNTVHIFLKNSWSQPIDYIHIVGQL
jgi:seryl-tRNA synthetase